MHHGIEIDMLSLGDADCLLVTQWHPQHGPGRVLVDGGKGGDAQTAKDFLYSRGARDLWAVICTHPHNDHAKGLIEVVQDKTISIQTAWMHDIRNHITSESLRRASAGNSSQADNVRQVVENTKELASAFASRNLKPKEPFAGENIAGFPFMTVLAPSLPFYQKVLREFTEVNVSLPLPSPSLLASLIGGPSAFGVTAPSKPVFLPPPPETYSRVLAGLSALKNPGALAQPAQTFFPSLSPPASP